MFEREDWAAFGTIEGLCRRAGTTQRRLASVVIRELVDNGLDVARTCEVRFDNGMVEVKDDHPEGIQGDDATVARLFSFRRPQSSTKFFRLPTRGALGNGLRVVAGAVAATHGRLWVATRGRELAIVPDLQTGDSAATLMALYDEPGTRVRLMLGHPLNLVSDDLAASHVAIGVARTWRKRFKKLRTSAHWYDRDSWH